MTAVISLMPESSDEGRVASQGMRLLWPAGMEKEMMPSGLMRQREREFPVPAGGTIWSLPRMKVGQVSEEVTVSATAIALQTETAAVQSNTTSQQLVDLPTSGHSWQTTASMMPGVAQPDYIQSGGSNNPTRSMGIAVNGQPSSNTVVRLDGVTQLNQYFQGIAVYTPGLEAIETVSLVTSSFDADQGMAGAAAVNVQVKSGTNQVHGSAFENLTDYAMKANNFFQPAGYVEAAVRPHSRQIAGVQPAFRIHRARRGFGLAIVALHHQIPARTKLAPFPNFDGFAGPGCWCVHGHRDRRDHRASTSRYATTSRN